MHPIVTTSIQHSILTLPALFMILILIASMTSIRQTTAAAILSILLHCAQTRASIAETTHRWDFQAQEPIVATYPGKSPIPGQIPGNSPFVHCCLEDTSRDLYDVSWVTLIPSSPSVGDRIQLMINGTMKQDIGPNATIIGDMHVSSQFETNTGKFDFCRIFSVEGTAENKCPPDKGETLLTAETIFTWLIPDGVNASVRLDLADAEGRRMTCLQGVVALQLNSGEV